VLSDPPIPSTFNFQVPAPQFQPSSINPLVRLSATLSALWTDVLAGGRMLDGSWENRPSKSPSFRVFWLAGSQYQPVFTGRGRIKNAKSCVFTESWTVGRIKHTSVSLPLAAHRFNFNGSTFNDLTISSTGTCLAD